MAYEKILKKELQPRIQSLGDDIKARRDKDYFWATGTQVYIGAQGSGKTISAVKHCIDLKERYPKAKLCSNLQLNFLEPIPITEHDIPDIDPAAQYYYFSNIEQLGNALKNINNGFKGVIYIIDEIHTYFNALDSKNIPMFVFSEIAQQRKQRKLIIGTSQLFMRMAKPLREQCDNLISCNTKMGVFTKQKAYDGMTLTQDYNGNLQGTLKKVGWFYHTRKLRNSFDTYQKIVSSDLQYEPLQILQDKKQKRNIFKRI